MGNGVSRKIASEIYKPLVYITWIDFALYMNVIRKYVHILAKLFNDIGLPKGQ